MDENTLQSLLTMRAATKHLGLAYETLSRFNSAGFGPPVALQVGHNKLYRLADLDAWNATRLAAKAA